MSTIRCDIVSAEAEIFHGEAELVVATTNGGEHEGGYGFATQSARRGGGVGPQAPQRRLPTLRPRRRQ